MFLGTNFHRNVYIKGQVVVFYFVSWENAVQIWWGASHRCNAAFGICICLLHNLNCLSGWYAAPSVTKAWLKDAVKIVWSHISVTSFMFSLLLVWLCTNCCKPNPLLIYQYDNSQNHTGAQSYWVTKWIYCMAIVNQIISPLLPVALEVGELHAVERLKVASF